VTEQKEPERPQSATNWQEQMQLPQLAEPLEIELASKADANEEFGGDGINEQR
jgi:hypothetical protein